MKNLWIVVLMSAMLTGAGQLSVASRSAGAQEIAQEITQATSDRSQVALIVGGALDRALPANPMLQYVNHELCGITLGGYCPGRYRSCIRAGRPKAHCEAWVARCDACNHAMLDCRQNVGHQPGYACTECRQALDKCRANLSAPVK